MLRREVEIMGSMRHPNCVSFYGACFEPGFTGIVTLTLTSSFFSDAGFGCSHHHRACGEGQHACYVRTSAAAPEAAAADGT